MKILILLNDARAARLYWNVFLRTLCAQKHDLICCVPHNAKEHDIHHLHNLGARVIFYPLQRKGLNIAHDIYSLWRLCKVFRREKPHILFASTVKAIIYGSFAAQTVTRIFRHPLQIFACITGLGYTFEPSQNIARRLLQKCIVLLYKKALHPAKKVFFQNSDDTELFITKNIVTKKQAILCHGGTGVDIEYFSYTPHYPDTPHFLLMARLLEAKGIRDYAAAAALLKEKYPHAVFALLGPEEHGLGALSIDEILSWQPSITYLGACDDVRQHIINANIIVLPSKREGAPCAVLEGMSMGRACIVTQVPGCQDIVWQGINGLCVPLKDIQALAAAMEYFITHPEEGIRMGKKARHLAQKHFDARHMSAFLGQHMEI